MWHWCLLFTVWASLKLHWPPQYIAPSVGRRVNYTIKETLCLASIKPDPRSYSVNGMWWLLQTLTYLCGQDWLMRWLLIWLVTFKGIAAKNCLIPWTLLSTYIGGSILNTASVLGKNEECKFLDSGCAFDWANSLSQELTCPCQSSVLSILNASMTYAQPCRKSNLHEHRGGNENL